eukprot:IDg15291t1
MFCIGRKFQLLMSGTEENSAGTNSGRNDGSTQARVYCATAGFSLKISKIENLAEVGVPLSSSTGGGSAIRGNLAASHYNKEGKSWFFGSCRHRKVHISRFCRRYGADPVQKIQSQVQL